MKINVCVLIYENLDLQDLDGEIWKDIDGYDDYQISNYGRIKSFKIYKEGKILKYLKNKSGYFFITLINNKKQYNKMVHRLLYETFNNCKLKSYECIHHINENKIDNNIENLLLINKCDHNTIHHKNKITSIKTKKLMSDKSTGSNNSQAKLKNDDVIKIRKLCNESNLTQKEIGKLFDVNRETISKIKLNRRWNNVNVGGDR